MPTARFWLVVAAGVMMLLPLTELIPVPGSCTAVESAWASPSMRACLCGSESTGPRGQSRSGGKPCPATQLVQRLRGGVIMSDARFGIHDSSDSSAASGPIGSLGPPRRAAAGARRKPRSSGGFKSKVVAEQDSGRPFHPHPDTLRPRPSTASQEEGELVQKAQEAVRIPMGGGAAVLTPMIARQVTRMARSVFTKDISPVLQRSSTRFAALVSPFRLSGISNLVAAARHEISPLVLGSPRRTESPDASSPPPPDPLPPCHEETRPLAVNVRADVTPSAGALERLDGDAAVDTPVAGARGTRHFSGLTMGAASGTATSIAAHTYARSVDAMRSAVRRGAERLEHVDLGTVGSVIVGYLVPGALYAMRVLLWLSLHSIRTVAIVLIDSVSSNGDGSPDAPRPAWTSPRPFPRSTPLPPSWRSATRSAQSTSVATPPPRYSIATPPRAQTGFEKEVGINWLKKQPQEGVGQHDELVHLARQHRERLHRRDAALPAAGATRAAASGGEQVIGQRDSRGGGNESPDSCASPQSPHALRRALLLERRERMRSVAICCCALFLSYFLALFLSLSLALFSSLSLALFLAHSLARCLSVSFSLVHSLSFSLAALLSRSLATYQHENRGSLSGLNAVFARCIGRSFVPKSPLK